MGKALSFTVAEDESEYLIILPLHFTQRRLKKTKPHANILLKTPLKMAAYLWQAMDLSCIEMSGP